MARTAHLRLEVVEVERHAFVRQDQAHDVDVGADGKAVDGDVGHVSPPPDRAPRDGCAGRKAMSESPDGGKAVVCAPFSVATRARHFIEVVSNTSTTPGSPTAT